MRRFIRLLCAAAIVALMGAGAHAQEKFVKSCRYIPATSWEELVGAGKSSPNWKFEPNALHADRRVYWNDDPVGQFLLSFLKSDWRGKSVTLEVLGAGDAVVSKSVFGPMTQPKAVLLLAVNSLPAGAYRLRATLPTNPPAIVETAFERANKANPVVPFPADGLPIRPDPQTALLNGSWPITTGVPFPQGTVNDLSRFALFEDGKEVPAQLTPVCTWHPEAGGEGAGGGVRDRSSISWARLSLVARYADGKPRNYVLRQVAAPQAPAQPRVSVITQENLITVDNGVVKFQVSKTAFRGVEAAWFDADGNGQYAENEKVIGGTCGAYVVDATGNVYEAAHASKPSVVIEEQNAVRAVIAAEGWYARRTAEGMPAGNLCKFRTRLIAFAGEPMVRIYQHTILTFDSKKVQLADVGFRVGVPEAQVWSLGADGKTLSGDVPEKQPVFLHQYRWNKMRVVGAKPGEVDQPVEIGQPPVGSLGEKSDGWFTLARRSPGAVTVLLRDVWQKFPKEVEMDASGFTLHFWPKHGFDTFSKGEMLARANIYKLWWHHQGKLLNLAFPDYVFDALTALNKSTMWDPEEQIQHARSGNAQGVAIGNEFILRFHKADAADQPAQAALFQRDPHAISDPAWNCKTLVEGMLAPYDPKRFPELEEDLNTFWPDYLRVAVGEGTEYGMWIYADVHDNWEPGPRSADLHRVWSASHYRNVSTAWLYYFRGCSPENLLWAAPNTDHFMDVATVNYASMGADEKGNPRYEFKFHIPGAMYHCKGFTPWGSTAYGEKTPDVYAGIWGHWINPDAFRYRYLLEGNGRAWDLYMLWGDSMKRNNIPVGVTREQVNLFGEALAYYRATWDADFLPLLNAQREAMAALPMDKWPNNYDHPGWHRAWFSRAYELTRDDRIKDAVLEYSKGFGRKFANMMAWDYQQTGDKSYLQVSMPFVYDACRSVYRNPTDPLSGCRTRFAAYDMFYYQEMPYYIQALNDAGITEITPGSLGRSMYLSHPTHVDFVSEKSPAARVIALKPDDREINVRLESIPGYDTYQPIYRVYSPTGRIVYEQAKQVIAHQTRYMGENAIVFKVPRDGETGLYTFDFRGDTLVVFAPYTDLPVEGVVIDRDTDYTAMGRCDSWLMPVGDKARVRLTWQARQVYPSRMFLGYVRLEDAKGNVLFTTTVLAGSKRASDSFELDTSKAEAPYRLYQFGVRGTYVKWSGTARLLVSAQSPDNVRTLAREAAKLLAAPPAAK